MSRQPPRFIKNARALRAKQTKAESLLWSVIRGRRLCNLKFRRQHPIPPFVVDFACVEKRLIIEIDGGYHDYRIKRDLSRQAWLESQGWRVLRFSNADILHDVESAAIAIARRLNLEPQFRQRQKH